MSWNCKHVCTCESFLSYPLGWPDELFWVTHSFPWGLCSWVYLCWQLWWETPAHHYRLVAKLAVLGKSKGCSMFQASFSNGISSEKSISESRDRLWWSLPPDGLLCDEEVPAAAPACSKAQVEEEGDEEDEDGGTGWTTAISDCCCCLRDEGLEGPASGAVACWPSDSTIWTRDSELRAEAPLLLTASSYEGRVTCTPSTMIDTGCPDTPWSRRWRDLSFGWRSTNSTTRSRIKATELAVDATMDKVGIPSGKAGLWSCFMMQLSFIWLSHSPYWQVRYL